MIRVLIYEDNEQLRQSLILLLSTSDDFEAAGAFDNCETAPRDIEALVPDVIIMDIDLPGKSGIEGVRNIRQSNQEVKILMLTVFEDNTNILEAIKAGANGYLLKKTPPDKLLEYIREAQTGGAPMSASVATQVLSMFAQLSSSQPEDTQLTIREKEVLRLLVEGNSYKGIAEELQVSIDTIRAHIRKIYQKLQVNSATEAVAKAIRNRIV